MVKTVETPLGVCGKWPTHTEDDRPEVFIMFVSCSIFVNFVPGKVKQDLYIGTTFINKQEGYTWKAFDFGVVTVFSLQADIIIESTEDIRIVQQPEEIFHPTRKNYRGEPVLKGWVVPTGRRFAASLNSFGSVTFYFEKYESGVDFVLSN